MTDCPRADVRDLLPDFLHGTLAPEARAAVAEHVAGCAACSAELGVLRAARAVMHRAPLVWRRAAPRIRRAVRARHHAAWNRSYRWRPVVSADGARA